MTPWGVTWLAIEAGPASIYNIVDEEAAEVSVWLPELAKALGAAPPRHLPGLLGKLLGQSGLSMMTSLRRPSNLKAKQVLNWRPYYASCRDGFHRPLAQERNTASGTAVGPKRGGLHRVLAAEQKLETADQTDR
jgi:nucleoside-diphosphate-sugar epimerase